MKDQETRSHEQQRYWYQGLFNPRRGRCGGRRGVAPCLQPLEELSGRCRPEGTTGIEEWEIRKRWI